MTTTTTYKCDLCSAAQPTHVQFWTLTLHLTDYVSALSNWHAPKKSVDCCRECAERLGLLTRFDVHTHKAVEIVPPTTEDLLREILSRIGIEAQT